MLPTVIYIKEGGMRKAKFLACGLWVLALVPGAWAQSKVDSQWKCESPSTTHSIEAGDQAGHAYVINEVKCTAVKGTIDGDAEKVGDSTEFHDVLPDKSEWQGMFVDTLASGDKLFIDFEGSGAMKDGSFASGTNSWTVVGGTGKFAGAGGKGKCTGKGNPDGTSLWDCTGTVEAAAPGKK